MQSPDFGNALPLGPYVACKTHCLGDYVNQHSPVHHPLETQYDQTNLFEQNFTKFSYKSKFAISKFLSSLQYFFLRQLFQA
jgi:hypothetical protein